MIIIIFFKGKILLLKIYLFCDPCNGLNQDIFLSKITNRDGLTDKVILPAPNGNLSNAPNPSSRPYSTYNIDIYKEGYYPQHYNNVPIFAGITAIQNARIIPVAEFDAQNPYYTQSQNFDEYENPFL